MREPMIPAEEASNPRWEEAQFCVHNWRNHVGEYTRLIWYTFTIEQQIALATDADERASNEEWD